LAIGIEKETTIVLGISLAVCFHKWAEGLTLVIYELKQKGVAFAEAGVDKRTATTMIMIQACSLFKLNLVMNPIGILIGWSLSSSGFLVTGVFESISAGINFLHFRNIFIYSHD
jgi:zinc transporter 1/2/3